MKGARSVGTSRWCLAAATAFSALGLILLILAPWPGDGHYPADNPTQ